MALHSLLVFPTTGTLHQALPSSTSNASLELNGTLGAACTFDRDCIGSLACVRSASRCGCPLDSPVLVPGGHDGLRCAPSRALFEPCSWHEQCAAVDPALVCLAGFCRCLRGGSRQCAVHGVNNTWVWAGCLAALVLCGAALLLCVANTPSRTKATSDSEAWLLSSSTVSTLPNPAAQRLLFSQRKPECTGRLGPTVVGRSLPRGFLSCHGLPEPVYKSSTQSCASKPEPHWSCAPSPPDSGSLELQVIELSKLGTPSTCSVHRARRASAPALPEGKPPARSPENKSSPALRSESGEPAAAEDAVPEWASKLMVSENATNASYGFSVDSSSAEASRSGFLAAAERSSRSERLAQVRRKISESLRRELADAWRSGAASLPLARMAAISRPPAFLSFEPSSEANGRPDPT